MRWLERSRVKLTAGCRVSRARPGAARIGCGFGRQRQRGIRAEEVQAIEGGGELLEFRLCACEQDERQRITAPARHVCATRESLENAAHHEEFSSRVKSFRSGRLRSIRIHDAEVAEAGIVRRRIRAGRSIRQNGQRLPCHRTRDQEQAEHASVGAHRTHGLRFDLEACRRGVAETEKVVGVNAAGNGGVVQTRRGWRILRANHHRQHQRDEQRRGPHEHLGRANYMPAAGEGQCHPRAASRVSCTPLRPLR